jgi:hypothetical protein
VSKAGGDEPMKAELERAKKYCQVIRAICHTQVSKAGGDEPMKAELERASCV